MCALKGILIWRVAIQLVFVRSVRRFAARNRWLPAQNGLASGTYFVKTADTRGVWRSLHNFRRSGGFLGDGFHRINKKIAFFLGLGFRRLNHHRSSDNEWKRCGIRMEAVIDQALRDVHRAHTVFLLNGVAE